MINHDTIFVKMLICIYIFLWMFEIKQQCLKSETAKMRVIMKNVPLIIKF